MNILSTLSNEEKQLTSQKTLSKNEVLYREGDVCYSVTIIISGEIKISSISFGGNELVYNILKKNEIFGNNLIFSDSPMYKGNVVATVDTTIITITKLNLIKLLQSNKDFLISYLNAQSNFSKKLNSTIKLLSCDSSEERFKLYLYQHDGVIHYKSVTNLALILHIQRETLSRLLTKLEKENVIKRSPHQISSID